MLFRSHPGSDHLNRRKNPRFEYILCSWFRNAYLLAAGPTIGAPRATQHPRYTVNPKRLAACPQLLYVEALLSYVQTPVRMAANYLPFFRSELSSRTSASDCEGVRYSNATFARSRRNRLASIRIPSGSSPAASFFAGLFEEIS